MNKSRNKNWLIIFAAIIIIFVVKIFYSASKISGNNTSQAGKQNSSYLNRNTDHFILTNHARCRMDCRNITENELKEILHDGEINYSKTNLNDARGASYALEGYTHEHQHLRVIFAPKKTETVVVTCIDLDKEWQCDCN